MQIKSLALLSTILGILVPMLVAATVVISYEYPLTFGSTKPYIYLAPGPNYPEASEMGLISLTNPPPSNSNVIMQQTIIINNVTGSDSVYLLNVLEIVNTSGWDTSNGVVYVLINVSNLNHVAVIASTSPINWPTSGINITSSYAFYIPKTTTSGPVLYISLCLWSGSASSVTYTGTIYITYYVEPAGSTYTP